MFWFSPQFSLETFLILRTIQRDIIINIHRTSYKVPVIPIRFQLYLKFPERVLKNAQISNFMKIRQVRAEFGRTDRQLLATSRFSQF